MMKKKATGKLPRGPRTTPSGTKYKPLAKATKPKEVKLGGTKAKMVGGIIAVPSKPKRQMF